MCSCSKNDYAGVYKGNYDMFSLTLTLKSDGSYVFKQYEPFTGGITERGKYTVDGKNIYYYDSRGKNIKYEGKYSGDSITLGRLKMTK